MQVYTYAYSSIYMVAAACYIYMRINARLASVCESVHQQYQYPSRSQNVDVHANMRHTQIPLNMYMRMFMIQPDHLGHLYVGPLP